MNFENLSFADLWIMMEFLKFRMHNEANKNVRVNEKIKIYNSYEAIFEILIAEMNRRVEFLNTKP